MSPLLFKSGRFAPACIAVVGLLAAVLACKPRQGGPLKFFYLKEASVEHKRAVESDTSISEKADYVVVANLPPRARDSGAALLRYWMASTDRARIERDFSAYSLWFLRESETTHRDYVPSEVGYTEYDRIDDHTDDLIATIEWRRCRMRRPGGSWRLAFVQDGAHAQDSILRDDCMPVDNAPLVSPARRR